MPSTANLRNQQITRHDVLEAVYESLIDAARRNRRFADIILDTRVMGASMNTLNNTWRVFVMMPESNVEVAVIIERAIKRAVRDASAVFN